MTDDFKVYLFNEKDGFSRTERLQRVFRLYGDGLDPPQKLERAATGKPHFADRPEWRFSISHSGDYWACAVGLGEVGLDLQKHQPARYAALARRFFHPEEIKFLESDDFSATGFFQIWTAKESYVKFTGQGLLQGLETFSVLSDPPGACFRRLSFRDDYSFCLCAKTIGRVAIYSPPLPLV